MIPNILTLTIPGRPVPKKNNQIMIKGRNLLLPSKAYKAYYDFCLGSKRKPGWLCQWGNIQFTGPVRVDAHYFFENYQWHPDLTGLLQATADILQAAGILKDDKQIITWGTSQIIDIGSKESPVEARAEITISDHECKWWRG